MSHDGVLLFSGGLDSLLSARILMDQGLKILCLHCVSPFYGSPRSAARWKRLFGVDVEIADAGQTMADILSGWPEHGFGKGMNPCVDCKIALLRMAKRRMLETGASFVATGEVVGQRPMSQRRDIMNRIRRKAGVEDLLLRPLCAKHLEPTPCELSGLVDRSRLLDLHGRGRQGQLDLAERYGFPEIPTPGGGCRLTERENARHYWPVRTRRPGADAADYELANCGRQLWLLDAPVARWMAVARNRRDNDRLRDLQKGRDLLGGLCDLPGPLVLLRDGRDWSREEIALAAAQYASYAPKAGAGDVRVWLKDAEGEQAVVPTRADPARLSFRRPTWEEVKEEKHLLASRREAELNAERERERALRRARRPRPEEAPAAADPAGTAACPTAGDAPETVAQAPSAAPE